MWNNRTNTVVIISDLSHNTCQKFWRLLFLGEFYQQCLFTVLFINRACASWNNANVEWSEVSLILSVELITAFAFRDNLHRWQELADEQQQQSSSTTMSTSTSTNEITDSSSVATHQSESSWYAHGKYPIFCVIRSLFVFYLLSPFFLLLLLLMHNTMMNISNCIILQNEKMRFLFHKDK